MPIVKKVTKNDDLITIVAEQEPLRSVLGVIRNTIENEYYDPTKRRSAVIALDNLLAELAAYVDKTKK
jgi:hypothetical protein